MYLAAAEIEQMEGVRKAHYLNGAAERLNKSLGDATGMKNLGVHLITVNEYLASRDADWMGMIHRWLGRLARGISSAARPMASRTN